MFHISNPSFTYISYILLCISCCVKCDLRSEKCEMSITNHNSQMPNVICETNMKREFNFWKNALQETPLPHCWSQHDEDRQPSIRLEDNARRVHFEEGEQTKKRWSRSVLADCTIPETCGIFYYENTIVSDTRDATAIAVGLVTSGFDVNRSVNIFLPSAYAVRSTGASWRPFFWQNS